MIINLIFTANTIGPGINPTPRCHPPRNSSAFSPDLRIILLYSARKNRANPLAEYSTLYPETSSASASGRSKGCRFVSASVVIKKIIKIGNSGIHSQRFDCPSIIVEKFSEPVNRITDTIVAPRDTS